MDLTMKQKPRKLALLISQLFSIAIVVFGNTCLYASPSMGSENSDDFADLDLEDLLNVEITSVSRKSETLSNAPAAVYVISNDELRHSGVTNIPDALRLVPGIVVARIDSNKWAVTSRGFNGRFANKLLVMIDGRSTYTSSFSGVYWEDQDTLLEDIERIEVIRGPGATLWGANAVNGVINIITKHSADTEGWYLKAIAGDYEKSAASLRYGSAIGDKSYIRGYGKVFHRDEFEGLISEGAEDEWDSSRAGLRFDSQLTAKDSLMVTANIFENDLNQRSILPSKLPPYRLETIDRKTIKGQNINTQWRHTYSPISEISVQSYISHNERDDPIISDTESVFDINFQHIYSGWDSQEIIWGLGYRKTHKIIDESTYILTGIDTKNDLFNGFLQNQFTLIENRLWLTLGTKFEEHDDTGTELLPSARIMWTLSQKHKLWGSASRSARTASEAERRVELLSSVAPPLTAQNPTPLPMVLTIRPNSEYDSELSNSYELGYRFIPTDYLSLDLTLFQNSYKDLRNIQLGEIEMLGSHVEQPVSFVNNGEVITQGFEASIVWRAKDWWHWNLAYSML